MFPRFDPTTSSLPRSSYDRSAEAARRYALNQAVRERRATRTARIFRRRTR